MRTDEILWQSQIKADMELKAVNKEALQRKQGTLLLSTRSTS